MLAAGTLVIAGAFGSSSAAPSGAPLSSSASGFERRVRDLVSGLERAGRAPIAPQRKPSVGQRGLRVLLNALVSLIVISLPFTVSAASGYTAEAAGPLALSGRTDAPRAQLVGRGLITAGRSPVTAVAEGVRPIVDYTLSEDDTLSSIGSFFHLSLEAVAFANGITDPLNLQLGRAIRIPPGEGALYTVAAADTVESVAAQFKVEPAVIMSYNRLYFEPEHFAPGQLIYVDGAQLPGLVYQTVEPEPERPVITRAAPPAPPPQSGTGRLARPVGGRITQYFSSAHTGVDIAAPYGTGIGASDAGVVSATGWVAVGGLRVCVKHAGGLETCYYHTSAVYVNVGQQVQKGTILAAIGLTGVTTGPHVHWELRVNSRYVDPLSYAN